MKGPEKHNQGVWWYSGFTTENSPKNAKFSAKRNFLILKSGRFVEFLHTQLCTKRKSQSKHNKYYENFKILWVKHMSHTGRKNVETYGKVSKQVLWESEAVLLKRRQHKFTSYSLCKKGQHEFVNFKLGNLQGV